VLAALAAHCTKAIFFPIGLHATYEPGILKQVAAGRPRHRLAHLVPTRTCRRPRQVPGRGKTQAVEYDPKDEIEKASARCAGRSAARPRPISASRRCQPPELIEYLGKRNIGIFSADLDSFDFKMRKPEQVRQSVMAKLKKHGKGIVLLHDFQHATGEGGDGPAQRSQGRRLQDRVHEAEVSQ
jgi:hypothetical protein